MADRAHHHYYAPSIVFGLEGAAGLRHLLRRIPLPAFAALRLLDAGLPLDFCPLVPSQVAFWRLVARLVFRLLQDANAHHFVVLTISPGNG